MIADLTANCYFKHNVIRGCIEVMRKRDCLNKYAEECVRLSKQERTEVLWLKGIYDQFRKEMGSINKQEADNLIYEKMYCVSPAKISETLKIRYWRNGQHVPSNREIGLEFARALDMSQSEREYFVQAYFDRADVVFLDGEDSALYKERKKQMRNLVMEYLKKTHPEKLYQLKISPNTIEKNIRHLYYTDALKYVQVPNDFALQYHITSINYGSELIKNLQILGEIPRTTMIRHLIILGMPFISKEIINQRLIQFGYLPLTEEHSLVGGERLDWMIIRLLELYESECRGEEPLYCCRWFQEACRILDEYFAQAGMENLRFMYFKSLKS